jgi:hypothetical protein
MWDLRRVLEALLKLLWDGEHVEFVDIWLDVATSWIQAPREVSELGLEAMGMRVQRCLVSPTRHPQLERPCTPVKGELVVVSQWRKSSSPHPLTLQLHKLGRTWTKVRTMGNARHDQCTRT